MDRLSAIIREDAETIVSRVDMSRLEGKFVIVTGATGLIGTYVAACLDVFGKCKVVLRMGSKALPIGHPVENFCKKWAFYADDMASPGAHNLYMPAKADYIFYAAGYGQPAKFTAAPIDTIGINTFGLTKSLRALNDGGRLLYVSSSEVYSGNRKPPFHEGDIGATTPQHPRGCYIEAKRCGEAICAAYNTGNPRNRAIAARLALAYGPGTKKDDDRVINQFIQRGIQDRRIVLRDAGQVIRTYCYVTDAVELMLNMWIHGTQDVYNVGGKSKVTIARLARHVGEQCGGVPVEIPPATLNSSGDAPDNVSLDTRLAEAEFKKTEYTLLEDGLKRTIAWQRILYGQV